MTISINVLLDVSGVDCPIPTIETKNALDQMTSGEVLKVISSKEGTINNIRTFVANNSCELLEESKDGEGFIFIIKKI
jgi:TusA-related sulfurtransferase